MIKKILLSLFILLVVSTVYFILSPQTLPVLFTKICFYSNGYNTGDLSSVVSEKELLKYDIYSMDGIVGLSGRDLRKKDLSQVSKEFLANIPFDSNTSWPESDRLPEGFVPADIIETGKNPGLGVRDIHKQGIKGQGISVAVFDKPIYAGHQEVKGRMNYIRIAPEEEKPFKYHFHGIMCASILAGDNIGVAPEAEIYYFACPDRNKNQYFYSLAIEKLIEINKSLLDEKKVKIVSISDSYDMKYKDALIRAEKAGIYVVYSNLLYRKYNIAWGGALPFADKNNPKNYEYDEFVIKQLGNKDSRDKIGEKPLLVPGNYRTVANTLGKDTYMYNAEGGFSSAIPYVVGLASLAWQIEPDLSLDQIMEAMIATKIILPDKNVINPVGFINKIKSYGSRKY